MSSYGTFDTLERRPDFNPYSPKEISLKFVVNRLVIELYQTDCSQNVAAEGCIPISPFDFYKTSPIGLPKLHGLHLQPLPSPLSCKCDLCISLLQSMSFLQTIRGRVWMIHFEEKATTLVMNHGGIVTPQKRCKWGMVSVGPRSSLYPCYVEKKSKRASIEGYINFR